MTIYQIFLIGIVLSVLGIMFLVFKLRSPKWLALPKKSRDQLAKYTITVLVLWSLVASLFTAVRFSEIKTLGARGSNPWVLLGKKTLSYTKFAPTHSHVKSAISKYKNAKPADYDDMVIVAYNLGCSHCMKSYLNAMTDPEFSIIKPSKNVLWIPVNSGIDIMDSVYGTPTVFYWERSDDQLIEHRVDGIDYETIDRITEHLKGE